jgi:hypothetical protein
VTTRSSRSLHERLASLEQEILALRAELGRSEGPAIAAEPAARVRKPAGRATRRHLLRTGGVVAAAGLLAAATDIGAAHATPASPSRPLPTGDGATAQLGAANANLADTGTIFGFNANGTAFSALEGDARGGNTTNPPYAGIAGYGLPTGQQDGVYGFNGGDQGWGIEGATDTGFGVVGNATTGIDILAFGTGRFQQNPTITHAGPPTASDGTFNAGEQIRDSNFDLWICVQGGAPGQWRNVAAPQFGFAGGALNLLSVAIRLLDTRGGAPIASHATAQIHAAGVGGIPAGATAVFGHVIAALRPGVNCGDGSSAILWPNGQPRPAAVNIVYNPGDLQGEYTGTLALVAIGASGLINLYSQPIIPVGVDYIFDAFGFVM